MIDGLIAGRLIGDPERCQGKGEHPMVNLIAFDAAPCAVQALEEQLDDLCRTFGERW